MTWQCGGTVYGAIAVLCCIHILPQNREPLGLRMKFRNHLMTLNFIFMHRVLDICFGSIDAIGFNQRLLIGHTNPTYPTYN